MKTFDIPKRRQRGKVVAFKSRLGQPAGATILTESKPSPGPAKRRQATVPSP